MPMARSPRRGRRPRAPSPWQHGPGVKWDPVAVLRSQIVGAVSDRSASRPPGRAAGHRRWVASGEARTQGVGGGSGAGSASGCLAAVPERGSSG